MAKPFLKWVGGKTQLLPELLARVPATFDTYHEPFLGGGALFWALQAAGRLEGKRVHLSDANERLIRTYIAVRDDVDCVIALLEDLGRRHSAETYQRVREMLPEELGDVQCAVWFIYLNRAGFNGLYRVNKAGRFNNPIGRNANRQLRTVVCDAERLISCSLALQGIELGIHDFDYARVKKGDFCYLDPPYVPLSATSAFTSYTADGFDSYHQKVLRDRALQWKRAGAHVLLSNSSAPAVYDLYRQDFRIEEVLARRNINAKGTGRGPVKEVLIT